MIPTEHVADRLTRRLALLGASAVAAGTAASLAGRSGGLRAFGQQTAAWGAIDLAIAGVGAARPTPAAARRLRRVLLVNAVLDVGYVAVGAHLAVRRPGLGGRLTPEAARGHGIAVVVQGLALLALDLGTARSL